MDLIDSEQQTHGMRCEYKWEVFIDLSIGRCVGKAGDSPSVCRGSRHTASL